MGTSNTQIYIKANRSVEVSKEDVCLSDVASVVCKDKTVLAKVKHIKLHHFKDGHDMRCIISVMEMIAMIQSLYPDVEVISLGETDTIIKKVKPKDTKFVRAVKTVFVALICFFGASFTIIAFHNDIGIIEVFSRIYELIAGERNGDFGTLELGYSLGLAMGIIVFFNHIGKRRITKDPTPIEVEMKMYEEEVEKALIDLAEKEKMEIEVK